MGFQELRPETAREVGDGVCSATLMSVTGASGAPSIGQGIAAHVVVGGATLAGLAVGGPPGGLVGAAIGITAGNMIIGGPTSNSGFSNMTEAQRNALANTMR